MNSDLSQKLVKIANRFRAKGGDGLLLELPYFIYLKLLSEEDSERFESLFKGSAERFRWDNWSQLSGEKLRDVIRDDVLPYLGSLSKETPQIAEIFRGVDLEIKDLDELEERRRKGEL